MFTKPSLPTGLSIIDAIEDRELLGASFRDLSSWQAWLALLRAVFGLPMSEADTEAYRKHTARSRPPTKPVREVWLPIGRRGGKSFISAVLAVYFGCFRDYRPYLAFGERATIMVLAADRRQARVVFNYIIGILDSSPMLRSMVKKERVDSIEFINRVVVEVHTSNYRSVRGYTVPAVLCDEIAFWPTEDSASPDTEILTALRPAMATIPDSLLVCASTPWARRGELYNAHRRYFGQDDDDVLVWQAASLDVNPTLSKSLVDSALERDPQAARAEWFAEFRTDIESFISREAVEACVVPGRIELRRSSTHHYFAFVDPSGGSSDSFTLAIGHRAKNVVVIDALREEKPPFSPDGVVRQFAKDLKRYRILNVVGDAYSGGFVRELFRKNGISYTVASKNKSELYRDLLAKINSGEVELLDNDKLQTQLLSLERRVSRLGRESIDHPPNSHDDLSNSVAGCVHLVGENLHEPGFDGITWGNVFDDADPVFSESSYQPRLTDARRSRIFGASLPEGDRLTRGRR